MKRFYLSLLFPAVLFLIYSCKASLPVTVSSRVSMSNMYNPTGTRFHPYYNVYHNSNTTSSILVKIFPSELLFSAAIKPDSLIAQVSISYVLTDITDITKPEPADSGSYVFNINRDKSDQRFIANITVNAIDGKMYQLALKSVDEVRREEQLKYLYLDKRSQLSEQNFLITDANQNMPAFQPYVIGNAMFNIESRNTDYQQIFVSYFGGAIPLPAPAFSTRQGSDYLAEPDSVWILPFKEGLNYQLAYEGIYFFQLDTNYAEGLTVFNFGSNYPRTGEIGEMIGPLVYLTSTAEYNRISMSSNLKLAVDNFWLENAGDPDRARELIRVYYNRVYFANYFFTSLKPGWQTDRGMIYIIYGPPQAVTVLNDEEKWVYYKNNFSTTVTFTFKHQPVPYSINNYVLERSVSYDTYWRQAVDSWRSGSIFIIK